MDQHEQPTGEARPPVQPGEPAPDFKLRAVHHEGMLSLADYRGRSPLFLAIFRGMYCPFCRRAIAELGGMNDRLRALGVETLAVVATPVDNARLYFKHRPTRTPIAADPECTTHRAYGLPRVPITAETLEALKVTKVNPTGELPAPMPVLEAAATLDRIHDFKPTETDQADQGRQMGQLKGQFLVDREGIVRWANVECARGLGAFGAFPSVDELLAAIRAVA